ncbi:actin-binding Rho-activating protein-like [Homarus americanus]|uniref:actin-binding Rho-activating protein-like n=1 Tax=Homarus americanus TaxID=6706 RepID=UPI001C464957|nr:actin-binding Rho-activating protein-like [Homarus americanus]
MSDIDNMGDAHVTRPPPRPGSLEERKAMLDSKMTSDKTQDITQDQPFALRHSSLTEKKQLYDQKVKVHSAKMGANPFSGSFKNTPKTTLSRDDPNYGKPVTGSKSERRGKNAARHINAEVVFLCDMIYQEGHAYEDGTAVISFGDLFQIYTRISNKVVGMLLRARKYGLVEFEGEMLFQRRDDDVPIALVKPIQEIRDELHKDQEFEVGVCHKADSR